jgi:hypothetical protein
MLAANLTNGQKSWLAIRSGWNFEQVHICPRLLALNKINPMSDFVCGAFVGIKFKIHMIYV